MFTPAKGVFLEFMMRSASMTISIRNHRLSATIMLLAATATAIPALWVTSGATLAQSEGTSKASRHCVKSISNVNKQVECFDSFTAAMSAATDGRITDAPADAGAAMKDQRFLEKLRPTGATETETIQPAGEERPIAILFSDADMEGSTLTYTADTRGCPRPHDATDINFADPYVGNAWNDQAESIATFNSCRAKLWEHRDFTGASIDFAFDRTDFGILADKVSSIQWS
jgi:hypothetical protein